MSNVFPLQFAVASGANCISVCYFEKENDWWLSKHIKKNIKSTVTCLDWHPNNNLLASGTARFAVNVFAAQVKEVGDQHEPNSPWYSKKPIFGDCVAGFRNVRCLPNNHFIFLLLISYLSITAEDRMDP